VAAHGKNGNWWKHWNHNSHGIHKSDSSDTPDRLLKPSGDYRTLLWFEKAGVVCALTFRTNYLIGLQLRRLEQDFDKEGGLRQRISRPRSRRNSSGVEAGGYLVSP